MPRRSSVILAAVLAVRSAVGEGTATWSSAPRSLDVASSTGEETATWASRPSILDVASGTGEETATWSSTPRILDVASGTGEETATWASTTRILDVASCTGEDTTTWSSTTRNLAVANHTVAMGGIGVSWGHDIAMGVAQKAARAGQGFAEKVRQASVSTAKSGLKAVGAKAGELLRQAVGEESADAMNAVDKIVRDFVSPMANGTSPLELWRAARAWGAMQHAAAAQAATPDSLAMAGEVLLPEDVERLLRFTATAYGAAWLAGLVDGLSATGVVRAATAQGGGPGEAAIAAAGLEGQIEVLAFEQKTTEAFAPGFLVAVDHDTGKVVVALRGTSSVADALSDLNCEPASVHLDGHDGLAHSGMLRAAQKLQGELAELVDQGLARLGAGAPRRVVITGHSLGAGVASLVAALWRDAGRFTASSVECLAFACPQVLDRELALAQSNHTTSIVVGNDLVPRFSLATAKDFRAAVLLLSSGISASGPGELLAAEARGDTRSLATAYEALRPAVCTSPGRLYPSGRLVHLRPGQQACSVGHEVVDELFIAKDMVSAHTLRSYLVALQEAAAARGQRELVENLV